MKAKFNCDNTIESTRDDQYYLSFVFDIIIDLTYPSHRIVNGLSQTQLAKRVAFMGWVAAKMKTTDKQKAE